MGCTNSDSVRCECGSQEKELQTCNHNYPMASSDHLQAKNSPQTKFKEGGNIGKTSQNVGLAGCESLVVNKEAFLDHQATLEDHTFENHTMENPSILQAATLEDPSLKTHSGEDPNLEKSAPLDSPPLKPLDNPRSDLAKVSGASRDSREGDTLLGQKDAGESPEWSDLQRAIFNQTNLFYFSVILSMTSFPLGWDIGTATSVVSHSSFPYTHGNFTTGIIVSSFNLGCLSGCLTLAKCHKNLKSTVQNSACIYGIGALVESICLLWHGLGIWGFGCGRFICGISCGTLCVTGPLYMSELLLPTFDRRPLYLSFWQTSICIMILSGAFASAISSSVPSYLIIIQATKLSWVLVQAVMTLYLPYSIKQTVIYGTVHDLRPVLNRIYIELDENTLVADWNYFRNIYATQHASLMKVLQDTGSRNTLIKSSCIMALQLLTGINYFLYYGTLIFRTLMAATIMGSVNLAGSLSSGIILQYFSIRDVMFVGSSIMMVCMLGYSTLGQFTALSITMICCFIFVFATSWGPCCGILINNLSDNNANITSAAIAVNWLVNWAISALSPICIKAMDFKYGYFFTAFLLIAALFVNRCIEKH